MPPDSTRPITVWSLESEPERLRATRAIAAAFQRRTGIQVHVVGVEEDALPAQVRQAKAARRLPDVMSLPLAAAHAYAREGVTDPEAARRVIERLGPDTFSERALRLVSDDGGPVAVPSDGWGQLIIYRRDLLEQRGLPVPDTTDALRYAAENLERRGVAGITIATSPDDVFTQQSFEHFALAFGCRLTDGSGRVTLGDPPCEEAIDYYAALARRYSPGGVQDADTTRDAYFAGRAAMIVWSPFLLDALAGLRPDARPACPQCRRDPAFLARNSGIVTSLYGPRGGEAQYGEISSWAIVAGGHTPEAERFAQYMLTDGYVRWLALSPQGKYPVRPGDRENRTRFVTGWAGLESGVRPKAPLRRFYPARTLDLIASGSERFDRWGLVEGQGALEGALTAELAIPKALSQVIRGRIGAGEAAARLQAAAERLQRGLR